MAMEIRTTPAILETKTTPPIHSIEQPKAEWNGSIMLPKVEVEITLPKVSIDQNAAFNESGLKDNTTLLQDLVSYAFQKMTEGTGRRASQGDQLTKIHQGGNAIAEQAPQNAYDQFIHEFGMVTMPKSGAQIEVLEGHVNITVNEGQVSGQFRAQKPIINYQQGRVERSMKQYSSISIRYLGENVDLQV
ncbi:MAG: hypothetical protein JEZ08_20380 [Clostridiales bacterium]|nr:hypothetical protein [Clostridiales bacterium]